jgi:hypothetical protein
VAKNRVDFVVGAKDQASKKLGKIKGALTSMGPAVTGVAAAWVSWQGITKALDATIGAAARQEVIFKKLESSVNLAGASYANAKPEIDSFLRSMQDTTRFGDTDMAPALAQITTLTGDLSMGLEGAKMAADIASSGLFDLNTASRYVAMAMSGEVTMLGRYIPELKVSAGLVNENMTATEKWAIAKDLLNKKFSGMAEADLNTYAGQMNRLKNELGDIGEAIGDTMLPALTDMVGGLADAARSVNMLESNIGNLSEIMDSFAGEGGASEAFIKALSKMDEGFSLAAEGAKWLSILMTLPKMLDPDAFVWLDKLIEFLESEPPERSPFEGITEDTEEIIPNIDAILQGCGLVTIELGRQDNIHNRIRASIKGLTDKEIKQLIGELKNINVETNELANLVGGPLSSATGQLVNGIIMGNAAFRDMKDFLTQILAQMASMVVQALAFKAAMSFFGGIGLGGFLGFHTGGMIPKAHSGTFAPDERLVLAQTGEAVLSRRATQAIGGRSAIDYMNTYNRMPPGGSLGRRTTVTININTVIGEERYIRENVIPIIENAINNNKTDIVSRPELIYGEY